MLKNSELKVNQGCNLKWKPGVNQQSEQFFMIQILKSRTVAEPL